jgi:hypothetical protein
MSEEKLVEKLTTWVEEHPEEADIPHINLTTEEEFTIREVLDRLVEEEESGVAIVDDAMLELKGLVTDWIGGE